MKSSPGLGDAIAMPNLGDLFQCSKAAGTA